MIKFDVWHSCNLTSLKLNAIKLVPRNVINIVFCLFFQVLGSFCWCPWHAPSHREYSPNPRSRPRRYTASGSQDHWVWTLSCAVTARRKWSPLKNAKAGFVWLTGEIQVLVRSESVRIRKYGRYSEQKNIYLCPQSTTYAYLSLL